MPPLTHMGAIIVVDAFWGDSGKGKVSAHLCECYNATYCARAGTGTNAGHSIYRGEEVIVLRQLPCGWLHPSTHVRVGSGVAVDPALFLDEVNRYGLNRRAKVDLRCPIITDEYRKAEQSDSHLKERIGSVGSGTGYTLAQFRLRRAKQAKDEPLLQDYVTDVAKELNEAARRGEKVVIECSQGTMLSLALSPDYPYVTSDNCTAVAAADDVGLAWRNIDEVVLVVKAVPSRVGEGPLPYELSQEEILQRKLAEYGVVSGRLRRKAAQIDWERLRYAALLNAPTMIALTFCDHYDREMAGARSKGEVTNRVWQLVAAVEEATGGPVVLLDTGKEFDSIIDLR